jgi:5'-3' exoribonuclease 1
MNQQRSRRFRSARDAIEARAAALRRGEPPPEGEPFDSNCITPGTQFMARLSQHLHFFVRKQQTHDPAWQRMTVILSGHEARHAAAGGVSQACCAIFFADVACCVSLCAQVPGEGEHKIMEHIRWARVQPGCAVDAAAHTGCTARLSGLDTHALARPPQLCAQPAALPVRP